MGKQAKFVSLIFWRNLAVLIIIFALHEGAMSQSAKGNILRYYGATIIYIADSSKVHWTFYPNPFSPPTYRHSEPHPLLDGMTFRSEMSGLATVLLIDSATQAILCNFDTPRHTGNDYTFSVWSADSTADTLSLPKQRIQLGANARMGVAIAVDGVIKNVRYERSLSGTHKRQYIFFK